MFYRRIVLVAVTSLAVAAVSAAASADDAPGKAYYPIEHHHVTRHNGKHHRAHLAKQHHNRNVRLVMLNPRDTVRSGNRLVDIARHYLGTNPTHRRTLWCGAFIDLVLEKAGYKGGGNLAKGYLRYGHRVPPEVGAIAVMGRRGGGHVGVVSGFDANGNPIIISGNHNRTTAEAVYPRTRIIAYVAPS